VPKAIVRGPFVGVGENGVGLGALLEFLLGVFVARIAVGMVFERELAVSALHLDLGHGARDAENFVIVALAHALATFTIAGLSSRSPIM
jgi:hypothetical protein